VVSRRPGPNRLNRDLARCFHDGSAIRSLALLHIDVPFLSVQSQKVPSMFVVAVRIRKLAVWIVTMQTPATAGRRKPLPVAFTHLSRDDVSRNDIKRRRS